MEWVDTPLKEGQGAYLGVGERGEQERVASGVDGLPYPAYLDWPKRQGSTPALKKTFDTGLAHLCALKGQSFKKERKSGNACFQGIKVRSGGGDD